MSNWCPAREARGCSHLPQTYMNPLDSWTLYFLVWYSGVVQGRAAWQQQRALTTQKTRWRGAMRCYWDPWKRGMFLPNPCHFLPVLPAPPSHFFPFFFLFASFTIKQNVSNFWYQHVTSFGFLSWFFGYISGFNSLYSQRLNFLSCV